MQQKLIEIKFDFSAISGNPERLSSGILIWGINMAIYFLSLPLAFF